MCIPNIIRMFKLRSMGWAGQVARVEEKRIEYRVWWGNRKKRNHSDYLGLDVRIILKIDFNAVRLVYIHLAQDGTSGGHCCNEF
jgi:hypothetical protein